MFLFFLIHINKKDHQLTIFWSGAKGNRTPDPLLAKQVLSQLSYNPKMQYENKWWAWMDLNQRPHPYQGCALTTWATGPYLSQQCLNIIPRHRLYVNKNFLKISKKKIGWTEKLNSTFVYAKWNLLFHQLPVDFTLSECFIFLSWMCCLPERRSYHGNI